MTDPWSFVVIPDTQRLATPASGLASYFNGMRDWIIDNAATHNIQWAGGVGDIIHHYGDDPSWEVAQTALLPLFDLDIPVLLLGSGNHDTNSSTQTTRNLGKYNTRFPTTLYADKPWFGGVFEEGQAQNQYAAFTAGGVPHLVFILEFFPRGAVLDWVKATTDAHPGHRVFILTHAYLHMSGTRDTWATDPYGPGDYFTEGVHDAHSGDQMWAGWFRAIPDLAGVFNGHYIYDNLAYRIDQGDAGNNVLQGFYNWQETANGGAGRVVLFTVDEDAGTIRQRVVRPDLDAFETGTSNGFDYDTTHALWTAAPPPAGDLEPGYYVVAADGGYQVVDDDGALKVIQIT